MTDILRATFTGSRLAWICSGWILLMVLCALLGVWLSGWDPEAIDWDALEVPPDSRHWFGTDLIGRDLFARIMLGAEVSLSVAVIATTTPTSKAVLIPCRAREKMSWPLMLVPNQCWADMPPNPSSPMASQSSAMNPNVTRRAMTP